MIKIYYDYNEQCVVFDRNNCGSALNGIRYAKVSPIDNKIKFQIFVDKTSVEVFINDGYRTLTANVYPIEDALGIEFFAIGGSSILKEINKYSIIVK